MLQPPEETWLLLTDASGLPTSRAGAHGHRVSRHPIGGGLLQEA